MSIEMMLVLSNMLVTGSAIALAAVTVWTSDHRFAEVTRGLLRALSVRSRKAGQ